MKITTIFAKKNLRSDLIVGDAVAEFLSEFDTGSITTILSRCFDAWPFLRTSMSAWVDFLNACDEYMEDVITRYFDRGIQTRWFEEKDRRKVIGIFKFILQLSKNTTGKNIFNSHDRLVFFIYSFDLEISMEALVLLYFYASKINQQRIIRNNLGTIKGTDLAPLYGYSISAKYSEVLKGEAGLNVPFKCSSKRKDIHIDFDTCEGSLFEISKQWGSFLPESETKKFIHCLRVSRCPTSEYDYIFAMRFLSLAVHVLFKSSDISTLGDFVKEDLPCLADLLKSDDVSDIVKKFYCSCDNLFN
jgi:hypothetical protein